MQVFILSDFPFKIKNFWNRFAFSDLITLIVKHY